MSPNKSSKRKRASKASSEATPAKKIAWKPRGPNFSAPAQMVTFFIGKEGEDEPFSVHKEFACHHSPVLNAAFNSNFIEGETQTYRLEDISVSAFRLLVQWFYHQKFDVFEAKDLDCSNDDDDPEIEKLWADQDMDLVQLWVVADKLLIRPLQNAAIGVLQGFWEESPDDSSPRHGGLGTSWIQYAYDHTIPESPLRNFAADICAYKVSPEGFADHPEHFPKEVLLDMAIVLSKAVTLCDDESEDEDEEDEEDEDEEDDEDAVEEDNESDESDDGEEEISEDEVEGGVIEDVPIHPTYECHRTWRGYLVPEDE